MKYSILYNKSITVELFNVMTLRTSIIASFWYEVSALTFFTLKNENVNSHETGEGDVQDVDNPSNIYNNSSGKPL